MVLVWQPALMWRSTPGQGTADLVNATERLDMCVITGGEQLSREATLELLTPLLEQNRGQTLRGYVGVMEGPGAGVSAMPAGQAFSAAMPHVLRYDLHGDESGRCFQQCRTSPSADDPAKYRVADPRLVAAHEAGALKLPRPATTADQRLVAAIHAKAPRTRFVFGFLIIHHFYQLPTSA
ncbi:hypothetical protein T492DRAFT_856306 [Pavlovales sp. CCMP2436]|nr:hypothetical protein T492DRAFT_856306 [Pavlovales sp. CCMP2436]